MVPLFQEWMNVPREQIRMQKYNHMYTDVEYISKFALQSS